MCGRQDEPGPLPEKRKSREKLQTQGFRSGGRNASSPSPTPTSRFQSLDAAVPVSGDGIQNREHREGKDDVILTSGILSIFPGTCSTLC